jgi:hypothetical protein
MRRLVRAPETASSKTELFDGDSVLLTLLPLAGADVHMEALSHLACSFRLDTGRPHE